MYSKVFLVHFLYQYLHINTTSIYTKVFVNSEITFVMFARPFLDMFPSTSFKLFKSESFSFLAKDQGRTHKIVN